jgi:hypothetical protein
LRLFARWDDPTILFIGTHFVAPTAGDFVRDGAAFKFSVSGRADRQPPSKAARQTRDSRAMRRIRVAGRV